MKLIKSFRTEDMQEIKTYKQNQIEFDNEYIKILKDGGAFFIVQYTGYNVDHFVLAAKDIDEAIAEAEDHILSTCDMIASETPDDLTIYKMELAKWGLFPLEDNQATKDDDFVAVIEEKSFNGYTPLICHGVYSYEDALAKKNELDTENDGPVYYLQHNENSRPCFYLIAE